MNQDDIDYFQPLPDSNKVNEYRKTINNEDFEDILSDDLVNKLWERTSFKKEDSDKRLAEFLKQFIENQKELPTEVLKIMNDNMGYLYERIDL